VVGRAVLSPPLIANQRVQTSKSGAFFVDAKLFDSGTERSLAQLLESTIRFVFRHDKAGNFIPVLQV
jgi:hypothetical protein